ncbi:unnamed protein product [Pneumocystis jirovecii]|uniref:Uncharacterized protein n=1 Tax=Pneumocystis jirovecii TaxID=42068 RepID=L0PCD0_PNEJI|nr:unnamed protein product [Pneumocystis jirovecii]
MNILDKKKILDVKDFNLFLQSLLKENENITKVLCFEIFDVILVMLESGIYNLKLFQTKSINFSKDDLNTYVPLYRNIIRKRSNSLNTIYDKIGRNSKDYEYTENFEKSDYYENFDTIFYIVRFIKNIISSITCVKEHTKDIRISKNVSNTSNKNIIINTLHFKNNHIPTLWRLKTILHKNISIIFLESTIEKANKLSTYFDSKLSNSSELTNGKYDILLIYEILFQLIISNTVDSIINPSKKYILKLNIQIPLCFFGEQIYVELYILYTTLIKLHKTIYNQLDKLNEISIVSTVFLKAIFFMCESLFDFFIIHS